MDSNHDKELQRLLCYHYTTGQDGPKLTATRRQRKGKARSVRAAGARRGPKTFPTVPFGANLRRSTQAAPSVKKNVLLACAQTVAADGKVLDREAELLRAIAGALDCPIPPFVEALESQPTC
jgi:hypothetical protein